MGYDNGLRKSMPMSIVEIHVVWDIFQLNSENQNPHRGYLFYDTFSEHILIDHLMNIDHGEIKNVLCGMYSPNTDHFRVTKHYFNDLKCGIDLSYRVINCT